MRILSLCPPGKSKNPYSQDGVEYDLTKTELIITSGIVSRFKDAEIFGVQEIKHDESFVDGIRTGEFDLSICNLTTFNANVSYLAGVVEGMGKPIIFYATSDHGELPAITHRRTLLYSEASLENEFMDAIVGEINTVMENPDGYYSGEKTEKTKQKAFISYSHADKEYLNRLLVHLKPLERDGLLDIWQDTQIKTGEYWEKAVNAALSEANIAILLISADFLASDFIVNNELPPLLSQAEAQGTRIVPVILSHCRFSRDLSLNRFQAVNQPNEPLSTMDANERESVFDKISSDIEKALEKS
jgi:hypothetical protein